MLVCLVLWWCGVVVCGGMVTCGGPGWGWSANSRHRADRSCGRRRGSAARGSQAWRPRRPCRSTGRRRSRRTVAPSPSRRRPAAEAARRTATASTACGRGSGRTPTPPPGSARRCWRPRSRRGCGGRTGRTVETLGAAGQTLPRPRPVEAPRPRSRASEQRRRHHVEAPRRQPRPRDQPLAAAPGPRAALQGPPHRPPPSHRQSRGDRPCRRSRCQPRPAPPRRVPTPRAPRGSVWREPTAMDLFERNARAATWTRRRARALPRRRRRRPPPAAGRGRR